MGFVFVFFFMCSSKLCKFESSDNIAFCVQFPVLFANLTEFKFFE